MFRGISAVNIDPKGRIAIPTRYRPRLQASQIVLTIDTEQPCLLLYPFPVWEEIERKITSLPSFQSETRRIQRLLIGHATELELDSQGRILLPPLLRDYALLDKRIIILGQGNKLEIWDEGRWQKSRAEWISEDLTKSGKFPDELRSISL